MYFFLTMYLPSLIGTIKRTVKRKKQATKQYREYISKNLKEVISWGRLTSEFHLFFLVLYIYIYIYIYICIFCCSVTNLFPTLCDPMNCRT